MLVEDLRSAHEDVERLEAAIAERVMDEPKHVSWNTLMMYAQQSLHLTDT